METLYDLIKVTTIIKSENHKKALDYIEKRGISLQTAEKYNLEWSITDSVCGEIVGVTVPTGNGSSITRYIDPPDSWQRYFKVGGNQFFNYSVLKGSNEPVFITEGEFDALSILQEKKTAVSLGGVSNVDSFMDQLKRDGLRPTLVLTLDNDTAGREATQKLQEKAKELGIACLVPSLGNVKDINELLCKDPIDFEKKISKWYAEAKKLETVLTPDEENVWQQYFPHRMDQLTANFDGNIRASMARPRIQTGFDYLDKAIGGGIREGIYVLGGAPSAGKTTFCLQIASSIAQQGQDVFLFSYEMTSAEIEAKNVVRTHCLSPKGKVLLTTNDVLRGEIFKDPGKGKAYQDASAKMRDVNKHLFFYSNDTITVKVIKDEVQRYIDKLHRTPVIIIDYLQMIPPTSERFTDKQNVDSIMLTLRQLKNMGVACFVISSLSRASYDTPIGLSSFKESGSIEFSADIALALDFEAMYTAQVNAKGKVEIDLNHERSVPVRSLLLTVLKNRLGQAGTQISFDFTSAGNLFQERGLFTR